MQTSTSQQFIETFKKELPKVAEFEGEPDQTLSVIIGALENAHLKDLLDELDRLRAIHNGPEESVKKPATIKTKAKPVVAQEAVPVETGDDDKKAGKPKRVTGYNMFVSEKVKVDKITMKEAAGLWKEMDLDARKPYNDLAIAENTQ